MVANLSENFFAKSYHPLPHFPPPFSPMLFLRFWPNTGIAIALHLGAWFEPESRDVQVFPIRLLEQSQLLNSQFL